MYLTILILGFGALINIILGGIAFAVAEMVSNSMVEKLYVKEDLGRLGWLVSSFIPARYTATTVELSIIIVFATAMAMINLFIYTLF